MAASSATTVPVIDDIGDEMNDKFDTSSRAKEGSQLALAQTSTKSPSKGNFSTSLTSLLEARKRRLEVREKWLHDELLKLDSVTIDEDCEWAVCICCKNKEDDGVPPPCRPRQCPLSWESDLMHNQCTTAFFGSCGCEYFDRRRKVYIGATTIMTILTMIFAVWGCFALSQNSSIVQRTYWAGGSGFFLNDLGNGPQRGENFSMYVGLRSFEYTDCNFVPGYESYPSHCTRRTIPFNDPALCNSTAINPVCHACRGPANVIWFTAFSNCLNLVMCVVGLQARVQKRSDLPVQKLIGISTEAFTGVTLLLALFTFKESCLSKLQQALKLPGLSGSAWIGPGYYCYLVCVLSFFIRTICHFIVPLPGRTCDFNGLCACCEKERRVFIYRPESVNLLPPDVKDRFLKFGWPSRFNALRAGKAAMEGGGDGREGGEEGIEIAGGGSKVEKSDDIEASGPITRQPSDKPSL